MNIIEQLKNPLKHFKELSKLNQYSEGAKEEKAFEILRNDLELVKIGEHLFSNRLHCYYYEFDNSCMFILYMDDFHLHANVNFYRYNGFKSIEDYLEKNKEMEIHVTQRKIFRSVIGDYSLKYAMFNRNK